MYFHGVRQRGTANLQPEPGSRGGARTVWRRPLASPVRRALYVAISRLLYNTSDGPSVIFQKLVAHPGFGWPQPGWAWSWVRPALRAGPLAPYLIIASWAACR
jgi:hypothetical protein